MAGKTLERFTIELLVCAINSLLQFYKILLFLCDIIENVATRKCWELVFIAYIFIPIRHFYLSKIHSSFILVSFQVAIQFTIDQTMHFSYNFRWTHLQKSQMPTMINLNMGLEFSAAWLRAIFSPEYTLQFVLTGGRLLCKSLALNCSNWSDNL